MHKKIMIMSTVFMIVVVAFTPVFADVTVNFPNRGIVANNVENSVNEVWATVTTVVQIAAFAAIVFAGVRYMFASADRRADIKNGLVMLVLGAMLVFAASTVVKFVVGVGQEIINTNSGSSGGSSGGSWDDFFDGSSGGGSVVRPGGTTDLLN